MKVIKQSELEAGAMLRYFEYNKESEKWFDTHTGEEVWGILDWAWEDYLKQNNE